MSTIMGMPKIGVNMTEATISKWLVAEGDYIAEGQPILEAETDKLTQEIPATTSGRIVKILANEGDTVEIQNPIAIVQKDGEEKKEQRKPEKEVKKDTRLKISPLAKKTAKQMGIDYTLVKPLREGARICKEDILRYAGQNQTAKQAKPAPVLPDPPAKPEPALTAGSMATLALRADMTEFLALHEKIKEGGGDKSLADMLEFFVSRTLEANFAFRIPHFAFRIYEQVEYFAPAAKPGEGCALGAGAIVKTPVAVTKNGADTVEIRPMMSLALCFDPNLVGEENAARFLQKLKHALENPVLLFCF